VDTMISLSEKESSLKRIILIITLLGCLILGAETAEQTLSLTDARSIALQNNSDYQAQLQAVESAKWAKTQALSSFLPSLSLSAAYLYMDPAQTVTTGAGSITLNHDFRTFGLSLSQPIFLGGKIWQGYQIAKISFEMAELSLQNQKLTLLAEVDNRYLALLQTKSLLEMTEIDYQSARKNLEIAQLKFDSSLISKADYLKFQSRQASKEVSLLQAQAAMQLAQLNLRNYLGIEYMPLPEALEGIDDDPGMLLLDGFDKFKTQEFTTRALARAESGSIPLHLTQRGVELSKRAYQISKGSFLPTLMLTGSRQYEENGIDRWDFTPSNQIMLTASLPILPQLGNYAAMRKSRAEYQKTVLSAETASQGIKLGTEASVLNLVNSAKQVRAAKLALDYTQQSYEQLQQRYVMNMISSTELLDAELMLSAARTSYTNSIYSYLKARAALMQALNLEDIQTLNEMLISGENK